MSQDAAIACWTRATAAASSKLGGPWTPLDDRLQELGGLDDLEVVEPDADGPARVERAVEGVGRPAELDRPARLRRRHRVAPEVAQLVHPLERPGERALRPVDLEREVALASR